MSDKSLAVATPSVLSKAQPKCLDLLRARAYLQQSEASKELFKQAREENWSADALAFRLGSIVSEVIPESACEEVGRYLADEYTQLGDGIFVISTETGKIMGVLREEDIYLPNPVPREGSNVLAQPTPKLRPDIEAAIILQGFESERETRILATLAAKGHQTDLLRDMGDPRLLVATRQGRRAIVESLAVFDPKTLLEACGGTSAAFLQCFTLVTETPDILDLEHIKGSVQSKSVMGVQDPTTTNLHHNRAGTLRGALVQGWVREIAGALSRAGERFSKALNVDELGRIPGVWVAAPHLVRPLRKKHPNIAVLPVSCPTFCLAQHAGYLKVPPVFETLNVEIFDRWEASAYLDYELWYDPEALQYFKLEGIDETPQVLLVDIPR
jgi:hypothetical protein